MRMDEANPQTERPHPSDDVAYEAPEVEDIENDDGPLVTAPGLVY
jgi:hypothetical protein